MAWTFQYQQSFYYSINEFITNVYLYINAKLNKIFEASEAKEDAMGKQIICKAGVC